MSAVGARAAAPLPKILPVIFAFGPRLLIAFGDINFPHQANMRLGSRRFHALVDLAIFVECRAHGFHSRRHPLNRADASGGGFGDGVLAASWHPERRMR